MTTTESARPLTGAELHAAAGRIRQIAEAAPPPWSRHSGVTTAIADWIDLTVDRRPCPDWTAAERIARAFPGYHIWGGAHGTP